MAQGFNLTAEINLRGPSNIRTVVADIRRQLGTISVSVNPTANRNSIRSIAADIRSQLGSLKATVNVTANTSSIRNLTTNIRRQLNGITVPISIRANAGSISQTVTDIRRRLSSITADVNIRINASSLTGVTAYNNNLRGLNATLAQTIINASQATAAINSLTAAMRGAGSARLQPVAGNFGNIGSSARAAAGGVAQAGTEIEGFGKQAGLALRRVAALGAVTSVIYGVTNAIKNGVAEFIEYDRQLTRISQVTGEAKNNLGRITSEIDNLSTSLGVSSNELATTSVTLAQAGLSAKDTERALRALALSALAPSFDDMNQTVEGSIALMKQFSISSAELEGALGSINSVAAKFAVEASDIITAIQRTGGVFAAASRGVSTGTEALNEFIAVFTSIRATTRESAETIATGLRTIFTRIQRADTIDALKEFGVTLTDLEGKFVGPYIAVQRLSEGLSNLDPRDLSFSRIVEELGGFRQIGKVLPLIQQFGTAQEALKVAQQGQGSLAQDAATGQLALAVQIGKVRQEFLALIRSVGNTDSFQAMVKVGLDLASALIKVADAAKGLIPMIGLFAAFKGAQAVTQFVGGFGRGIRGPSTQRSHDGGPIRHFATGGYVQGFGNGDTVRARLTPGEFVMRKSAVQSIGVGNLSRMNTGGRASKFDKGGPVPVSSLLTRSGGPSIRNAISTTNLEPDDTVSINIVPKSVPLNQTDFLNIWLRGNASAKKGAGKFKNYAGINVGQENKDRLKNLAGKNEQEQQEIKRSYGPGISEQVSMLRSAEGRWGKAYEEVLISKIKSNWTKASSKSNYPVDLVQKLTNNSIKRVGEAKFRTTPTEDIDLISKLLRYRIEKKSVNRYFTENEEIPKDLDKNIGSLDYFWAGNADETKNYKKQFYQFIEERQKIQAPGFVRAADGGLIQRFGIGGNAQKQANSGVAKEKKQTSINQTAAQALLEKNAGKSAVIRRILSKPTAVRDFAQTLKKQGVTIPPFPKFVGSGMANAVFDIGNKKMLKVSLAGFGDDMMAGNFFGEDVAKKMGMTGNYQLPMGIPGIAGYSSHVDAGILSSAVQDKAVMKIKGRNKTKDADKLIKGLRKQKGLTGIDLHDDNIGYRYNPKTKKQEPVIIDGLVVHNDKLPPEFKFSDHFKNGGQIQRFARGGKVSDTFYHGTGRDLEQLDVTKSPGGVLGAGAYLGLNKTGLAADYARKGMKHSGGSGGIYPVQIKGGISDFPEASALLSKNPKALKSIQNIFKKEKIPNNGIDLKTASFSTALDHMIGHLAERIEPTLRKQKGIKDPGFEAIKMASQKTRELMVANGIAGAKKTAGRELDGQMAAVYDPDRITGIGKPIRPGKRSIGGLIQRFEDGGIAEELKSMGRADLIDLAKKRGVSYDQSILDPRKKLSSVQQAQKEGFLRSLTEAGILARTKAAKTSAIAQSRSVAVVGVTGERGSQEVTTPGATDKITGASVRGVPVTLQTGALPPALARRVQALIRNRVERIVADVGMQLSQAAGMGKGKRSRADIRRITSKDLEDITGGIFEKGLGAANLQYDEKSKAIDLPQGLNSQLAKLVGVDSGVMTDVQNTASKETAKRKIKEGQFDRGRLEDRSKYGRSQFAIGGSVQRLMSGGFAKEGWARGMYSPEDVAKAGFTMAQVNARDNSANQDYVLDSYDLLKKGLKPSLVPVSDANKGAAEGAAKRAVAIEELARTGKAKFPIGEFEGRGFKDSNRETRRSFGGSIQKFKLGGNVDHVMALLTPGEAVLDPATAATFSERELSNMNHAEKHIKRRGGGGISIVPGVGDSDTYGPVPLAVGSYVFRKKATQALGLSRNSGGPVGNIQAFASGGDVQRFFFGGSPVGARPDNPTASNISISSNVASELRTVAEALSALGIISSSTAVLLQKGGAISYLAATQSMEADLRRMKIAGASSSSIYQAEQKLQNIRQAQAKDINARRELKGLTGGQLQEIDTKSSTERQKLIDKERKKLVASGLSSDKIEEKLGSEPFQDKINRKAYQKATSQTLGAAPANELFNRGVSGSDISQYTRQSMMDKKTLAQMDAQLIKQKTQELTSSKTYGSASEAEKKRMLASLKQATDIEIRARRQLVGSIAQQGGLPGPGGDKKSSNSMQSMMGASFGVQMLGSSLAGQFNPETSSANAQAAASITGFTSTLATSGMLVSGAFDMLPKGVSAALGPFAVIAIAGAALGQAFIDARNASIEFEKKFASNKAAESLEKVSKGFKDLEKDIKDIKIQDAITKNLIEASDNIKKSISIDSSTAKAFWTNMFDAFGSQNQAAASKRSQILEKKGMGAYVATTSIGAAFRGVSTEKATQENYASLIPQKAQENSKQFAEAASGTMLLLENKLKSGTDINDIIDKSSTEWKSHSETIARSNATIEAQILSIDNIIGMNEADKEAKKQLIIGAYAESEMRKKNVAIQREIAQKELENSGNLFARSFTRMFTNMEQSIGRASFALNQMSSEIDLNVSALSGQAQTGKVNLQTINTLQNPRAYSEAENKSARSGAASLFGNSSKEMTSLLAVGETIESTVMSTINKEMKAAPSGVNNEVMASRISSAVSDALAGLELPADLSQQLGTEVSKALEDLRKDSDNKMDFSDTIAKVGSLNKVIDTAKQAQEIAIKALEHYQNALNVYSDGINKITDLQIESLSRFRKAIDITTASELSLSRALGDNVSVSTVASNRDASVASRTGGLTNPNDIYANVIKLNNKRQNLESESKIAGNKVGVGVQDFMKFKTSLGDTNTALRENIDALKYLAENTDVASEAMNKIQEAQQKQSGKVSFIEKLVTSTPGELDSIGGAMRRLENNMNGQINNIQNSQSAQKAYNEAINQGSNGFEAMRAAQEAFANDRKETLGALNDILPFLGDTKQGNNIKADVLQSMLQESGQGVSPLFQQVLNTLRNPAVDPAVQAAIEQYRQANSLQADANNLLGKLNDNLSRDIANASAKALSDSLKEITFKFDDIILNDIRTQVTAINTKMPEPVKAVGKASGGVIYAAAGGVNFTPQGTDTVPAMLTPGEFVVNRSATSANLPLLQSINKSSGGKIGYYADGGYVSNFIKDEHRNIENLQATDKEYISDKNLDNSKVHKIYSGPKNIAKHEDESINGGKGSSAYMDHGKINSKSNAEYIPGSSSSISYFEGGTFHHPYYEYLPNGDGFNENEIKPLGSVFGDGSFKQSKILKKDYEAFQARMRAFVFDPKDIKKERFSAVPEKSAANSFNSYNGNRKGGLPFGFFDSKNNNLFSPTIKNTNGSGAGHMLQIYGNPTTSGRVGGALAGVGALAAGAGAAALLGVTAATFGLSTPLTGTAAVGLSALAVGLAGTAGAGLAGYNLNYDAVNNTGLDNKRLRDNADLSFMDPSSYSTGPVNWIKNQADIDSTTETWQRNKELFDRSKAFALDATKDPFKNSDDMQKHATEREQKLQRLHSGSSNIEKFTEDDSYDFTNIGLYDGEFNSLSIVGDKYNTAIIDQINEIKDLKNFRKKKDFEKLELHHIGPTNKDEPWSINLPVTIGTYADANPTDIQKPKDFAWIANADPAKFLIRSTEELKTDEEDAKKGKFFKYHSELISKQGLKFKTKLPGDLGDVDIPYNMRYNKYRGPTFFGVGQPNTDVLGFEDVAGTRQFFPGNNPTDFTYLFDPTSNDDLNPFKTVQQSHSLTYTAGLTADMNPQDIFNPMNLMNNNNLKDLADAVMHPDPKNNIDDLLEKVKTTKANMSLRTYEKSSALPYGMEESPTFPVFQKYLGPTNASFNIGDYLYASLKSVIADKKGEADKGAKTIAGAKSDPLQNQNEFLPKLLKGSLRLFGQRKIPGFNNGWLYRHLRGIPALYGKKIQNNGIMKNIAGYTAGVFDRAGSYASSLFPLSRNPNQYNGLKEAYLLLSGATSAFGGIASGNTGMINSVLNGGEDYETLFRSLGASMRFQQVANTSLDEDFKNVLGNMLQGSKIAKIGANGSLDYESFKDQVPKNYSELVNLGLNPYNTFSSPNVRETIIDKLSNDISTGKDSLGMPYYDSKTLSFITNHLSTLKKWYAGDRGGWVGQDSFYDEAKDPTTRQNAVISSLSNNVGTAIRDQASQSNRELGAESSFGSLPDANKFKQISMSNTEIAPQFRASGGMIYASAGQMVDFSPRGTDTVPAMLTPGEFVVNRAATQANLPLLHSINSGGYSKGGSVSYLATGGEAPMPENVDVLSGNYANADDPSKNLSEYLISSKIYPYIMNPSSMPSWLETLNKAGSYQGTSNVTFFDNAFSKIIRRVMKTKEDGPVGDFINAYNYRDYFSPLKTLNSSDFTQALSESPEILSALKPKNKKNIKYTDDILQLLSGDLEVRKNELNGMSLSPDHNDIFGGYNSREPLDITRSLNIIESLIKFRSLKGGNIETIVDPTIEYSEEDKKQYNNTTSEKRSKERKKRNLSIEPLGPQRYADHRVLDPTPGASHQNVPEATRDRRREHPLSPRNPVKELALWDINNDGQLTFDEFFNNTYDIKKQTGRLFKTSNTNPEDMVGDFTIDAINKNLPLSILFDKEGKRIKGKEHNSRGERKAVRLLINSLKDTFLAMRHPDNETNSLSAKDWANHFGGSGTTMMTPENATEELALKSKLKAHSEQKRAERTKNQDQSERSFVHRKIIELYNDISGGTFRRAKEIHSLAATQNNASSSPFIQKDFDDLDPRSGLGKKIYSNNTLESFVKNDSDMNYFKLRSDSYSYLNDHVTKLIEDYDKSKQFINNNQLSEVDNLFGDSGDGMDSILSKTKSILSGRGQKADNSKMQTDSDNIRPLDMLRSNITTAYNPSPEIKEISIPYDGVHGDTLSELMINLSSKFSDEGRSITPNSEDDKNRPNQSINKLRTKAFDIKRFIKSFQNKNQQWYKFTKGVNKENENLTSWEMPEDGMSPFSFDASAYIDLMEIYDPFTKGSTSKIETTATNAQNLHNIQRTGNLFSNLPRMNVHDLNKEDFKKENFTNADTDLFQRIMKEYNDKNTAVTPLVRSLKSINTNLGLYSDDMANINFKFNPAKIFDDDIKHFEMPLIRPIDLKDRDNEYFQFDDKAISNLSPESMLKDFVIEKNLLVDADMDDQLSPMLHNQATVPITEMFKSKKLYTSGPQEHNDRSVLVDEMDQARSQYIGYKNARSLNDTFLSSSDRWSSIPEMLRLSEVALRFDNEEYFDNEDNKKGIDTSPFGTSYYSEVPYKQVIARANGGMIYASAGQLINYEPRGTDTVPAMLTPGEFVVNRAATQANLPLLQSINKASGGVIYAQEGRIIPGYNQNIDPRKGSSSMPEMTPTAGEIAFANKQPKNKNATKDNSGTSWNTDRGEISSYGPPPGPGTLGAPFNERAGAAWSMFSDVAAAKLAGAKGTGSRGQKSASVPSSKPGLLGSILDKFKKQPTPEPQVSVPRINNLGLPITAEQKTQIADNIQNARDRAGGIMERYASTPENAARAIADKEKLTHLTGVNIDPALKDIIPPFATKGGAGPGVASARFNQKTGDISFADRRNATERVEMATHETLHAVQQNSGNLGNKNAALRPIVPQIKEFLKPGGAYDALLNSLTKADLNGIRPYTGEQLLKIPHEIFTSLGQFEHTKAFRQNPEASEMLKSIVKAYGYNKGGVVYAAGGGQMPLPETKHREVQSIVPFKNLRDKELNDRRNAYEKQQREKSVRNRMEVDAKYYISADEMERRKNEENSPEAARERQQRSFERGRSQTYSNGGVVYAAEGKEIQEEKSLTNIIASNQLARTSPMNITNANTKYAYVGFDNILRSDKDLKADGTFTSLKSILSDGTEITDIEDSKYDLNSIDTTDIAMVDLKDRNGIGKTSKSDLFKSAYPQAVAPLGVFLNDGDFPDNLFISIAKLINNNRQKLLRRKKEGVFDFLPAGEGPSEIIFSELKYQIQNMPKEFDAIDPNAINEDLDQQANQAAKAAEYITKVLNTNTGKIDITKANELHQNDINRIRKLNEYVTNSTTGLRILTKARKQNNTIPRTQPLLSAKDILETQVTNGTREINGLKAIWNMPQILQLAQQAQTQLAQAQNKNQGGMIYASAGQLINYQPRGTDTVPAMLTPGEFVVNRAATQANLPLLQSINKSRGGSVNYKENGGIAYLAEGANVRGNAVIQQQGQKPTRVSLVGQIVIDPDLIQTLQQTNQLLALLNVQMALSGAAAHGQMQNVNQNAGAENLMPMLQDILQNLNINNGNQAPDRIEQPGNRAQEFALGRARNTSARAREDAETRFGRNPEVMKLQGPEREQKLKSLYTRDGADKKKTRNWDMGQTLEDNIRDHANKKNASDQLLQQQQKDRLGGAAPQPKAAPPPNPDNPEPLRKPQPFVPQAPNQDNRPKMDMDQRTQTQGNGMPDFSSISQSVSSFGAALTTATTALSDYQAKLSSSGSSDSVSNTGGQSFNTDALTEFASKFESLIGQLSQINLPTEITMTGRHEVNVMINGASAFEGMKDGLRDLVMSEINNSMNNYTAGLRQQTEGALA